MIWAIILLPLVLSAVFCRIVMALPLKDAPDGGRKIQSAAIPTAGGLAIAAATVVSMAILLALDARPIGPALEATTRQGGWQLVAAVAGAGLVGFLDDWTGMAAKVKFAALAGLSVLAAFHLDPPSLHGPWMPANLAADGAPIAPVVAVLGLALWCFVMANASNFMDGSNGLAVGCLTIMLAGLVYPLLTIAMFAGDPSDAMASLAALVLVMASIGFLAWNLRGMLYAGDTGALLLGLSFAVLGAISARHMSIWLPATLALPFLVDVFLTLIWRARRGENLLHAHRDHAYQLFIRAGWRHIPVAMIWWALTVLCAFAGVLAAGASANAGFWTFWMLLAVGVCLWIWQRRVYAARVQ